eukprot:6175555-Pleurochrysis_carterae.AAC.1
MPSCCVISSLCSKHNLRVERNRPSRKVRPSDTSRNARAPVHAAHTIVKVQVPTACPGPLKPSRKTSSVGHKATKQHIVRARLRRQGYKTILIRPLTSASQQSKRI